MNDADLTRALAAADQQYTLVKDTLGKAIDRARELLATYGETESWSLLGMEMKRQLDLDTKYQQFAGEMVAAAAIRIAQST